MNSISIILTLDYLQYLHIVPCAHPLFLSFFLFSLVPPPYYPDNQTYHTKTPPRCNHAKQASNPPHTVAITYHPPPPFPSSHHHLIYRTLRHPHKQHHLRSSHPRLLRLRPLTLILPLNPLTPQRRPRALPRQQRHRIRRHPGRERRREGKRLWRGGRAREDAGKPSAQVGRRGRPVQGWGGDAGDAGDGVA